MKITVSVAYALHDQLKDIANETINCCSEVTTYYNQCYEVWNDNVSVQYKDALKDFTDKLVVSLKSLKAYTNVLYAKVKEFEHR